MPISFATLLATLLVANGCIENMQNPIDTSEKGPQDSDTAPDPDETGDTNPWPDDVLTGGVEGRICAPNQHVYVAQAKISIEHAYGVSYTFTDQDGYFLLDNVPTGTYTAVVSKGSFQTTFEVFIPPNEIIELATEECFEDDLNIAVVTGEYDNISKILGDLGLSFDTYNGLSKDATDFLRDPEKMAEYDIIFFNCGLTYDYMNPTHMGEVSSNLEGYVDGGGSVYASDWAYFLIEKSWPDMIDFRNNDGTLWDPALGVAANYSVEVSDEAMINALGGASTASIRYDLDVWITPITYGGGAVQMVHGTYRYWVNDYQTQSVGDGPLAVKLEDSSGGRVIYTTFHNEAQTTLDMDTLLREIIWAL